MKRVATSFHDLSDPTPLRKAMETNTLSSKYMFHKRRKNVRLNTQGGFNHLHWCKESRLVRSVYIKQFYSSVTSSTGLGYFGTGIPPIFSPGCVVRPSCGPLLVPTSTLVRTRSVPLVEANVAWCLRPLSNLGSGGVGVLLDRDGCGPGVRRRRSRLSPV